MEVKNLSSIVLSGIKVRTCNANEMKSATAKIADLWQTFVKQYGPSLGSDAQVYGVYCNYENDMNGYFDVIACSDTNVASIAEVAEVTLHQGDYLVFSAQGKMPDTIIALWGEVWHYFSDSDCPHQRNYKTDYEFYKSKNEVEIAIGIKTIEA
jgi:predicted transcriptional regulator YdeE